MFLNLLSIKTSWKRKRFNDYQKVFKIYITFFVVQRCYEWMTSHQLYIAQVESGNTQPINKIWFGKNKNISPKIQWRWFMYSLLYRAQHFHAIFNSLTWVSFLFFIIKFQSTINTLSESEAFYNLEIVWNWSDNAEIT